MRPDILTAAGRYFDFTQPEACEFSIAEIAHALGHLCRFNGHVRQFYSVAQHSVMVSRIVPREHALAGLLHDAPEAFIGDVAAPLKQLLPDYRALEQRIEAVVLGRFGLAVPLHPEVKRADLVMLATEQRDLMPAHDDVWEVELMPDVQPLAQCIVPWTACYARDMFVARFRELVEVPCAAG